MTKIIDEIPFTNEALKIYIQEADKELSRLHPLVLEYNRIKTRRKRAQERLDEHGG